MITNFLSLKPIGLLCAEKPGGLLYADPSGEDTIARSRKRVRQRKPLVHTREQAAKELNLSKEEVDRLFAEGQLRKSKFSRRKLGVTPAEINRYRLAQLGRLSASQALKIELLLSLPLNPKK